MRMPPKIICLIISFGIITIVAIFLGYRWWAIRNELAKTTKQNEDLLLQIEELREKIKKMTDEIRGWKSYRDEEHGFELDIPTIGWEFKQESRGASVCRISDKTEEEKRFCIGIAFELLRTECSDISWQEIFASGQLTAGKGECIIGRSYGGNYQKEIQTTSGAKGYKGEIIFPLTKNCTKESIVFFLIRKKVERNKFFYFPLVSLSYLNCPAYIDFGDEEIKVFDKIISSFRFIEK